jgi:hypothetical protein
VSSTWVSTIFVCYLGSFSDKHYQQGSHWVAIWFPNNKRAEYFDSFGNVPPDNIRNFLFSNFKVVYYNSWRLQEKLSIACGGFAIWFLYQRSLRKPFEMVHLKSLADDDEHVIKWLNKKCGTAFVVYNAL